MTAYFDKQADRVRELRASRALARFQGDSRWGEQVEALEREVVWDVTQCAASPGLPPELREAIHRSVLRWQLVTLPSRQKPSPEADALEPPEQLSRMIEELHGVFHTIGRYARDGLIEGFTDDPTTPMQRRFDDEEDIRENLRAAAQKGPRP